MDLKTHIHPYVKEADAASFTFQISKEISEKAKWVLKIDRPAGSKIDRTIKDFALEEIYSQHTSLEVKDIIDFHESYPKDYINTFIDNLFKENNKGLSKTDVYRILFGVEAEAKKFLDRPFSKLKHDLLKQIGVEI